MQGAEAGTKEQGDGQSGAAPLKSRPKSARGGTETGFSASKHTAMERAHALGGRTLVPRSGCAKTARTHVTGGLKMWRRRWS